MNYQAFLSTVILFISTIPIYSQQATVASGGDIQGTSGSASYTVGQSIYTTIYGTSGTAVQGIQNPVIKIIDGIERADDIQIELAVYPNPTANFLTLKIGSFKSTSLTYQIHDMNGKIIKSRPIMDLETTISLEYLAAATYFMVINDDKQLIKTFSIVKR